MTTRRTASGIARDENAVAAVVGFVLIFAVAISYYGYVAKAEVPRWGLENEQKWDDEVGSAMLRLARESDSNVGLHISVAGAVPRPPAPESLDVPLVGKTQPVDPDGMLEFDAACSGITSARTVRSTTTTVDAGGGCLRFDAIPVYGRPFSYQIENGALLRIEGDRAHMVSPPPLKLRTLVGANDVYEVLLTTVSFGGPSRSTSVTGGNVAVDLLAGPADVNTAQGANVHGVTWTITTDYPTAWQSWLNQRLAGAGFAPALNAACVAGDTAAPCAGLTIAANEVVVVLNGPNGGTANTDPLDVSYTLTQGSYSVSIR